MMLVCFLASNINDLVAFAALKVEAVTKLLEQNGDSFRGIFFLFSPSFECLMYPSGMWRHFLIDLPFIYPTWGRSLAVQAGFRTRHITTSATTTACRNCNACRCRFVVELGQHYTFYVIRRKWKLHPKVLLHNYLFSEKKFMDFQYIHKILEKKVLNI